jgi:hypothetical protein
MLLVAARTIDGSQSRAAWRWLVERSVSVARLYAQNLERPMYWLTE